jgi:hypothetical protein
VAEIVYVPASKGLVGPLARNGLLISDATPKLLRLEELELGIAPDVVLKVTVPVGNPCPDVPKTLALSRTGLPKGALENAVVYWPV